MTTAKALAILAILTLGMGGLHAQENTVASGGEASGTGGTQSYSIGQMDYVHLSDNGGQLSPGVQQPYEIFATIGLEKTISLMLEVFPNPASDYLTLKMQNSGNVCYQLYDAQGKIHARGETEELSTIISVSNLAKATYFLRVENDQSILEIFKIIKN